MTLAKMSMEIQKTLLSLSSTKKIKRRPISMLFQDLSIGIEVEQISFTLLTKWQIEFKTMTS